MVERPEGPGSNEELIELPTLLAANNVSIQMEMNIKTIMITIAGPREFKVVGAGNWSCKNAPGRIHCSANV